MKPSGKHNFLWERGPGWPSLFLNIGRQEVPRYAGFTGTPNQRLQLPVDNMAVTAAMTDSA